jgi:aryl-alcohol dehydrogenase-like predicted oxidoreductase
VTGVLDELVQLPVRRAELDCREVELIDAALDAGETFTSLARLYGFTSQAMGQRYRKLGGTRGLQPGRPPKTTQPPS